MGFSEHTNKPIDRVLAQSGTSQNGLLPKEVFLRQKEYGLNEIKTRRAGIFDILLRQTQSSFFYLLLIAGTVSFFIGEKIDSIVILVFVSINVALGFVQEFKAENT